MPFTTAARADTSPPVVNVHLTFRLAGSPRRRPSEAVFCVFSPNIGQSADDAAAAGVGCTAVSTTADSKTANTATDFRVPRTAPEGRIGDVRGIATALAITRAHLGALGIFMAFPLI